MRVVEVKGLTYTYPGRKQPSLREVTFSVSSGEFVLICGETGCGKSTLLSCLNGLIPFESGGVLKGEVWLFGQKGPLSPLEAFPRVATVFQNPTAQLISDTVFGEVAFALENLGLPREEVRQRVEQALDFVGLRHRAQEAPGALSGGQRQRLAIASALAVKPRLLLLDEPLSQLDPKGIKEVLQVLRRLSSQGQTILLVEHRVKEVTPLVDKVIYLRQGQVVYKGPPQRCPQPVSKLRFLKPPLAPKRPVLEVRDLTFGYPGQRPLFQGVNLVFYQGERVALLGENGTGKSTFLGLLAGLLRPTQGEIRFSLPRAAGRLPCTLLLQDPDLMLFRPTVREELGFAPRMLKVSPSETQARISQVAKRLGIETYLDDPPFGLSRGERLRTALASLLTGAPQVLLLDEPTTAQDQEHVQAVLAALEADLIVFSTHDHEAARNFAHRIIHFPMASGA